MTPKEKADSIFQQMYKILWHTNSDPIHCKQCALIAVDEIINCDTFFKTLIDSKDFREYWYNVQEEIQKL
jgi:hypothetical protein